jgi:voltage-dependent calcium channel T type alpha-1H
VFPEPLAQDQAHPARRRPVCLQQLSTISHKLIRSKYFEEFISFLIFFNAILWYFETPFSETDTTTRHVRTIDLGLTSLFTLEIILRLVDFFAASQATSSEAPQSKVSQRHAVRQNMWRMMLDGSFMFLGWLGFFFWKHQYHFPLKVVRLIRAFQPIRAIYHIDRLRYTTTTLLYSMKPIWNVCMIISIFYILFAILGVQLFKGSFSHCSHDRKEPISPDLCQSMDGVWTNISYTNTSLVCLDYKDIESRDECLALGCSWEDETYHFDNIASALLSLFVVSSRDGWVEVMYNGKFDTLKAFRVYECLSLLWLIIHTFLLGMDAVGPGRHPIRDHNPAAALYFMIFLLTVGYFIMNMFVGVVVENFQRTMPSQSTKPGK